MLDDAEITRILAIAAHADDLDFGAAGTIARWTEAGIEVIYCLVTDGDAGGLDEDAPRPWTPCTRTPATPFAFPELREREGLAPWKVREVWLAGSPSPTHFVDVTATFGRKIAALRAHESQTGHLDDLEERIRGWFTRGAALGGLPAGHLAESFQVLDIGLRQVLDTGYGPTDTGSRPNRHGVTAQPTRGHGPTDTGSRPNRHGVTAQIRTEGPNNRPASPGPSARASAGCIGEHRNRGAERTGGLRGVVPPGISRPPG